MSSRYNFQQRHEASMYREQKTEGNWEGNASRLNGRFILLLTLPLGMLFVWLLFALALDSSSREVRFAEASLGTKSRGIAPANKPRKAEPISDTPTLESLHQDLKEIELPSVAGSLGPKAVGR